MGRAAGAKAGTGRRVLVCSNGVLPCAPGMHCNGVAKVCSTVLATEVSRPVNTTTTHVTPTAVHMPPLRPYTRCSKHSTAKQKNSNAAPPSRTAPIEDAHRRAQAKHRPARAQRGRRAEHEAGRRRNKA